jgi:hypothetical protein
MSNYCYKGISLNNIIYGASSADYALNINEHYYTNDSSNNTISTTPSTVPINGIEETPNQVSYEINDDDISEYCIASFLEGSSGTLASVLPSWCNNIRVVLVGGGSGGAYSNTQIQGLQLDQHDNNSGYNDNNFPTNKFHNDYQVHYHHINTIGGNGGAGGGFIYISSLKTSGQTSLQTVCGQGGAAGGNGQNTSLTLIINGTTYDVQAGGAQTTSGGTNSLGGLQATSVINYSGFGPTTQNPGYWQEQEDIELLNKIHYQTYYFYQNPSGTASLSGGLSGNNNNQTYFTKDGYTYGNGGAGGTNMGGQPSGGAQGYYRIYFLT